MKHSNLIYSPYTPLFVTNTGKGDLLKKGAEVFDAWEIFLEKERKEKIKRNFKSLGYQIEED